MVLKMLCWTVVDSAVARAIIGPILDKKNMSNFLVNSIFNQVYLAKKSLEILYFVFFLSSIDP